jgi:hypothetical protein
VFGLPPHVPMSDTPTTLGRWILLPHPHRPYYYWSSERT